jgi:flagellar protein FlaG
MSHDGLTVKPPMLPPATNVAAKQVAPAPAQPVEVRPAPVAEVEPLRSTAATIEAVARRLDSYLKGVSRSLEFRVDQASGRTVCTVLDGETGDVIRQIPNEEVLRMAEMVQDQTIVLMSERA